MPNAPLKTFIIYARDDKAHKDDLLRHLKPLVAAKMLHIWHDGDINPGEEWEKAIKKNLKASEIILVLVTVNCLNSEFIQTDELETALLQMQEGESKIIPIIVSPCGWKFQPIFRNLQGLPEDMKAITKWENRDEAWTNVIEGIAAMVEHIHVEKAQVEKKKAEDEELQRLVKLAEAEKKEAERLAKIEAERVEKERLAKIETDKQEAERLAKIAEVERLQNEKIAAAEKAERERLAKIEAERMERERLLKIEGDKQEKERLAKIAAEEKAERERLAKIEEEKQEKERLAKIAEAEERERIEKIANAEKAEKERLAKIEEEEKGKMLDSMTVERERLAKIKAEEKSSMSLSSPQKQNYTPYYIGGVALSLLLVLGIWQPWNDTSKNLTGSNAAKIENPITTQTKDPFEGLLVPIPAGSFMMGSNEGNAGEKPVHKVNIASFYMLKTEVTQSQWKAIIGANPSSFSNCEDCPVENVSWDDIQVFLKKLNAQTGKNYRLPTEAEWEYAARGGESFLYAGSNKLDEVAWYRGNAGDKTHPVGKKKANGYGLYDMSGNVWEWCEDDYHDSYKGTPTDGSAWIDNKRRSFRVFRGGSWYDVELLSRLSYRFYYSPSIRYHGIGFRLVFLQSV